MSTDEKNMIHKIKLFEACIYDFYTYAEHIIFIYERIVRETWWSISNITLNIEY